jgi:hypothetical protein
MRHYMKINSTLRTIVALVTGLTFMIVLMSCVNQTQPVSKEKREIVVYSKCSSGHAFSDILYSVNEIKEQLRKKGISVKTDNNMKLCGYLLVNGTKTKTITGALTDFDLLQEVNNFFKIELYRIK